MDHLNVEFGVLNMEYGIYILVKINNICILASTLKSNCLIISLSNCLITDH